MVLTLFSTEYLTKPSPFLKTLFDNAISDAVIPHSTANVIFKAQDDFSKKKFYALVEFPYPSGVGMHLGHIKAYSGLEVIASK